MIEKDDKKGLQLFVKWLLFTMHILCILLYSMFYYNWL